MFRHRSCSTLSRPLDPSRPVAFVLMAILALLTLAVIDGGAVRAHTGFESSDPSDGAVVDQPVSVVTIVFTGEATPVGDGFVALTADGVLQTPISADTTDNKVFTLRFDPALTGGQTGVRWNVKAADAHPIEGAFSFTVSAAPPTSETAATTVPDTSVPGTGVPATTVPDTTVAGAPVPGTTDPATASGVPTPVAASAPSLEEFLTVDDSAPGTATATVGRLVGLLGVTLGIGVLAFTGAALRGPRREIVTALTAVRALGVVIAVGALIEYIGVGQVGGESFGSTWSTAPGFATVLRFAGGLALAVGLAATISPIRLQRAEHSLSAALLDEALSDGVRNGDSPTDSRWVPDARSVPAAAGVVLLLVSFWFDGHTVSKGVRPLHAAVNTVHVAAGSVWVGGVVALAAIAWTRHRSGRTMRVAELVIRFSKIATIALACVIVAGGVMALFVLDSIGDLTGTAWGQTLLLKTAAVALAVMIGAYNHFRLLPALESEPDSPGFLAELRSTVTAEAILLLFVVAVTAWLVAAAT